MNAPSERTLYFSDNLDVLRRYITTASIDLVYLDPPFNSSRTYNVTDQANSRAHGNGKVRAFEDVWRWDERAANDYDEALQIANESGTQALIGFRALLGECGMLSYLTMLTVRLSELHRALKPTGSIYLHCDQHSSACLRLLMDALFGGENFLNSLVWCYGLGGSSNRYWPRKHDDILWYSRERMRHYFNPAMVPATSMRMKGMQKKAVDYWNIPAINNRAKERLGYPTQKPEKLLERIILASSRAGDVVLDPYCGSGTTLAAAEKLNRRWIGIDNSPTAIAIAQKRLNTRAVIQYEITNFPA